VTTKYWIKLYHEILHDPKMARMPDNLWRRCIELFLMAGENADDGSLPPIEDIAWGLRVDAEHLETEMIELQNMGILSMVDGEWYVTKFVERQAALPKAEYMRRKRNEEQRQEYYQPVTISNTDKRREDKEKRREESPPPPPNSSANIFRIYEREIGTITKNISDELTEAERTYPSEWFEPAFAEASRQNKRSWAYVSAILKSWNTNGFKSLGGKPPNPNKPLTLEEKIKLVRKREGLE